MRMTDSLKEIERRAYRSTFNDGIYDILFGMLFLILALVPVLESIGIPRWYGYLFLFILPPIPWLGKRYVTIPRLGAVEFGPKRKSRGRLLALILAAILFLQMPVILMAVGRGFFGSPGESLALPLTIGMLLVPLIAVAAYFMDFPRMYVYALVLSFGILHSGFMFRFVGEPLNSLISFGTAATAILAYGLTLLFGFMKRYPKSTAEAHHVS
jgi:hypothetical protein